MTSIIRWHKVRCDMSKVPEVSIIMPNRCYEGYIGGPVFSQKILSKKMNATIQVIEHTYLFCD